MQLLAALFASFVALAVSNPVGDMAAREPQVHCEIVPFLSCKGGIDQQVSCQSHEWTCLKNGAHPIIRNITSYRVVQDFKLVSSKRINIQDESIDCDRAADVSGPQVPAASGQLSPTSTRVRKPATAPGHVESNYPTTIRGAHLEQLPWADYDNRGVLILVNPPQTRRAKLMSAPSSPRNETRTSEGMRVNLQEMMKIKCSGPDTGNFLPVSFASIPRQFACPHMPAYALIRVMGAPGSSSRVLSSFSLSPMVHWLSSHVVTRRQVSEGSGKPLANTDFTASCLPYLCALPPLRERRVLLPDPGKHVRCEWRILPQNRLEKVSMGMMGWLLDPEAARGINASPTSDPPASDSIAGRDFLPNVHRADAGVESTVADRGWRHEYYLIAKAGHVGLPKHLAEHLKYVRYFGTAWRGFSCAPTYMVGQTESEAISVCNHSGCVLTRRHSDWPPLQKQRSALTT
ncbi:hypothetical protein FB45DRAFT_1006137 [Roridomyces roridus]|uniref:Uncharacterized protein n=1 Tax=Roridomyces roridus TaxID=1738132 RepID=A0AAD7FII1_9AGAR|nr:hypothetical protein FB45DRAFT_1006137 [Roridomyces roridus]